MRERNRRGGKKWEGRGGRKYRVEEKVSETQIFSLPFHGLELKSHASLGLFYLFSFSK